MIDVSASKLNILDCLLDATTYNIRHVAFTGGEVGWDFEVSAGRRSLYNKLSTLVSLVIHSSYIDPPQVRTLLSFTPNLEFLELGSLGFYYYSVGLRDTQEAPLMQSIRTLCPKLTHIYLGYGFTLPDDDIVYHRDYLQVQTKGSDAGLQYYWNEVSALDQAEYDMILRSQSTLEHLHYGHRDPSRFTPDWEAFTRCFLPNTTLKHLHLVLSDQTAVDWLYACQALEHLELHTYGHTIEASMMDTLERQLPSLRRIDLTFHDIFQSGTPARGGGVLNQMQLLRVLRYRCNHTDSLKELQLNLDMNCSMGDFATILSYVMTIRTLESLTLRRGPEYIRDRDEPDALAFFEGLRFSLPRLKHLELDSFCDLTANAIHALATLCCLDSIALVDTMIDVDGDALLVKTMGKNLKDIYFVCNDSPGYRVCEHRLHDAARDYAPRCRIHVDGRTIFPCR